jgi:hypothetical protein
LGQFRLRNSQRLELRLQRAIVEQGDGDGGLHGEIGAQQALDGFLNLLTFRVVSHPTHFLTGAGRDLVIHVLEGSLRIRAGATAESQWQQGRE